MIDKNNKFTEMQQQNYDLMASFWTVNNRDPVVGTFDAHNSWPDYDEFLFKDLKRPSHELILLDFGCGPGRNLVKYNNKFKRLDGVDISQINLNNAKLWVEYNKCNLGTLYQNNGFDLSNITENIYDVVMSTICFQHICVYDIRKNYLREFYRVLKKEGYLTIQMGFGGKPNYFTVPYLDNKYDALGTNGACDVSVSTQEELIKDLNEIGFSDFNFYLRPTGPGDSHQNWIFFNCKK